MKMRTILRLSLAVAALFGTALAPASAQRLETLEPKPDRRVRPAASDPTGPLLVVSDLDCTIQVDGVTVGSVDADGRLLLEARAGERLISALGPGSVALWRQVVEVRPGLQTAALVRRLEPQEADAPLAPSVKNLPSGMELIALPPSEAEIGCLADDRHCRLDEKPRNSVRFTDYSWMTATPVTVDQYAAFAPRMGAAARPQPRWSRGDHPVVNVTWSEASAFCEWTGGRLPTEAEWERAARGGDPKALYPWGRDLSRRSANYGGEQCCEGLIDGADRWEQTSPVDALPPNPIGLFDMAGNVWEWTADWYTEHYGESAGTSSLRSVRGGSWRSRLRDLRSSARSSLAPDYAYEDVGFRCILPPASPKEMNQ